MTGLGHRATAVMASCSRSTSVRAARPRAAMEAAVVPVPAPSLLPPLARMLPIALRSSPTEKCGPLAAMTTARTAGSASTAAMARGRSCHRSRPMALRASARSSHTVATPSSCSMLKTGDANPAISPMTRRLIAWWGRRRRPLECMGAFAPERGFDRAYLQRRGVRGPGGPALAPRAAGRRLRGLRIDPVAVRGRGGLALHADRRPRSRGVRARPSRRAGPGSGFTGGEHAGCARGRTGLDGRERARLRRTARHRRHCPRTCATVRLRGGRRRAGVASPPGVGAARRGRARCCSTMHSLPTRCSSTCRRG